MPILLEFAVTCVIVSSMVAGWLVAILALSRRPRPRRRLERPEPPELTPEDIERLAEAGFTMTHHPAPFVELVPMEPATKDEIEAITEVFQRN